MSFDNRAAELLLPFRETRSSGDARHVIATWAARSLVQYFVIERIAIITWQNKDVTTTPNTVYPNYGYSFNFISDLGANACHVQDQGAKYGRWVCSPLFPLVDLSFIFLGLGVLVVAALITTDVLRLGGKQRIGEGAFVEGQAAPVTGRAQKLKDPSTHGVRLSMTIAGLGLIGVGTWPETDDPTMHGNSTGAFLIFGVISLLLLSYLWWKEEWTAAVLILLFAIVAAFGGMMMLALNHNDPTPAAILGTWERMVVYGFIAGIFVMGYTLSIGRRTESRYYRTRASGRQTTRVLVDER